jgi:hypothetical protein
VFNAPADRAALASYRDAGIARVLFKVTDLKPSGYCGLKPAADF